MAKLLIVYKSGYTLKAEAEHLSLKVSASSGELTEIAWENMQPQPIFIGINEIAAIYQLDKD